jgi:hypothetical protein
LIKLVLRDLQDCGFKNLAAARAFNAGRVPSCFALMMSVPPYTLQPRMLVPRLTLADVPNNLPSLMDIVRPWISSLGIGIADPDPEMLDPIEGFY